MLSFLSDAMENYITMHSEEEPSLLRELRLFTENNSPAPQMLSGNIVGRFLRSMVKITNSRSILEIGTFTGYSALCLAEGILEDGEVVTLDKDSNAHRIASKFFERSPYKNKIVSIQGDAIESLKKLAGPFDLVFVDADKVNYNNYYELVLPKMRKGGLIIFDNCLLQGTVPKDKSAIAVHKLNERLREDSRVENIILSIRDGLHLALVN